MKTECPHCHAVFRVSEQLLQQGDGQVRCGHCLAIFTAEVPRQMSFDDLLDAQDDATQTDAEFVAADESNMETSYSSSPGYITSKLNAALRRNTAALHEQNVRAETIDVDATHDVLPETNAVTDNVAEMPVELEAASTADATDENITHVLPDVIPPSLRAEARSSKKRFGFIGNLFWFLALCIMIVVGFAQYAWYDRMHLLQYPQARPWFELACDYLHCQLPEPRDVSLIELSRKNIYTHPNDKHGLMVSGTMVNTAGFAQAFPLLELRFENIRGEAIAVRRFTPDEYLDLPEDEIQNMKAGEPVAFTLEIVDPGPDVVSYEFTFL